MKEYNHYKKASPDRYALLKTFAQDNRVNQTEAESSLWQLLKGKNLGVRFRRQYIIGDYITDFVCLECQLVIEVDGGYHRERLQQEDDALRTAALERMGFRVIRFTNEQVMLDTRAVYEQIKDNLNLYDKKR